MAKIRDFKQALKKVVGVLLFFFLEVPSAWAAEGYSVDLNVDAMLLSIQQSLPQINNLAIGAAYVMGIAFIFKGIYDLKMYGEQRSMMSSSTSMKAPLFTLFAGAMCLFSPSAFNVVMMSTFGYGSPLAYDELNMSSSSALSTSATIILQIIQVIGTYAFFKGWFLLARSGSQSGHGLFGQGLMHVVGGIFAMNVVGTCNVIAATFGISF